MLKHIASVDCNISTCKHAIDCRLSISGQIGIDEKTFLPKLNLICVSLTDSWTDAVTGEIHASVPPMGDKNTDEIHVICLDFLEVV